MDKQTPLHMYGRVFYANEKSHGHFTVVLGGTRELEHWLHAGVCMQDLPGKFHPTDGRELSALVGRTKLLFLERGHITVAFDAGEPTFKALMAEAETIAHEAFHDSARCKNGTLHVWQRHEMD